jgi:acyl carrier protein
MIFSEAEVRTYILNYLEGELTGRDIDALAKEKDSDLIGSGIISSLEFIGLITAIEQRFNIEIDFEEHDPSSYTTILGLSDLAVKSKKGLS